jgi:hypothetical protein
MTIDYFISIYFVSAFITIFPILVIKNLFLIIKKIK